MKKIYVTLAITALLGGGAYEMLSTLSPARASSSSPSIDDTFPTGDTLNIGTTSGVVSVKNFYKTLIDTEEGSAIMKENDNYEIFYDRNTSQFYIFMPSGSSARPQAESDLLSILGIGQQDACKLSVSVIYAGQENNPAGLSFCASQGQGQS